MSSFGSCRAQTLAFSGCCPFSTSSLQALSAESVCDRKRSGRATLLLEWALGTHLLNLTEAVPTTSRMMTCTIRGKTIRGLMLRRDSGKRKTAYSMGLIPTAASSLKRASTEGSTPGRCILAKTVSDQGRTLSRSREGTAKTARLKSWEIASTIGTSIVARTILVMPAIVLAICRMFDHALQRIMGFWGFGVWGFWCRPVPRTI